MIDFLLRKMWKNKWMMFCLLVGNILLVGIVSATPLYTQATMERILQQNFRQHGQETGRHPAIMELNLNLTQLIEARILPVYHQTRDEYVPSIAQTLGVPVYATIETNTLINWRLLPDATREESPRPRNMSLMGVDSMADNVRLLYGRLPSDTVIKGDTQQADPEADIIEALASEATLIRNNLLVGELLRVSNVNSPAGPLYVRIVGVYEFSEGSEFFWSTLRFTPAVVINTLLIPNDIIRARFLEPSPVHYRIIAHWYHMLDYPAFIARQAEYYLDTLAEFNSQFNLSGGGWQFITNFNENLTDYLARTAPLATTLWVLQVPIYVMLALYIYMVSRQILALEQNHISVLKSRGASRKQLLIIYALQGLFVSAISLPAGVWLGIGICHMLGASSGFLYLVQRAALTIEITWTVLLYAGIAMLLSFLTMFVPVIGFSRVAIVDHKQKMRSSTVKKPLWQRFYLDILFFGVALYGLYTFNNQREIMAALVRDAESVDPLLFISSSLFILGAGLLALRLFPYLVKLVYMLGRRFWSPQTYAALLKVVRSSGEEQFIMIFLVLTLAVGIFSSHAARTINTNNNHRIQYLAGADLMFREFWRNNIPQMTEAEAEMYGIRMPNQVVYFEPDFERFTRFDEVDALTRVQRHMVRVVHPAIDNIRFMAIETNTFGETIWFRDDLLRIHINHFLNVLAENPDGVLLSSNFKTVHGYGLGDFINVRDGYNHTARLEIVGFVDYWPGYAHFETENIRLRPGETVQVERFLAVANLGYIQSMWGVLPYQIWMRTNSPTNQFFYDFQAENDLRILEFSDSNAAIVESRGDPILQGTNGVLTVNFIVTLLICFVGLIIYWVLSIRSRVLQFGIFRAMGMSMGRVMALLINEQLLITFTSIGIGTVVGIVTAHFFVPLIQISYTAAQQVIPLAIVIEAQDYRNLFAIISAMVILCLVILGVFIMRIKIVQALKLGED